jgi:galactose mutarotase-like enzyme
MAEIDPTQPYKTYVLRDLASQAQLSVVPERGGIITQWSVMGQEMFYLDRDRYLNPELSVRGGIPILFPICGNLPNNTYTHQGQTYTLKQHGFARELPWEVIADNDTSLTIKLTSNSQTLAVYPFAFEVTFTYALLGHRLVIGQHYANRSAETMPFSAGFHPYFSVLDKTQLQLDIPSTQFWDNRTQTTEPFSGFDFDLEEMDWAFKPLSRRTASVIDHQRNLKLTLNYDDHYSTLVFWTLKGKDFYCLEPWSAPRNALNTGEHLLYLQPGESLSTEISLMVSNLTPR